MLGATFFAMCGGIHLLKHSRSMHAIVITFVLKVILHLSKHLQAVYFDEVHEDVLLESLENPALLVVRKLVLARQLANFFLMFLEIFLKHLNVLIKDLLLEFERLDAVVLLPPRSLRAVRTNQLKGFAIVSPMLHDLFLIVELRVNVANFLDTAGF